MAVATRIFRPDKNRGNSRLLFPNALSNKNRNLGGVRILARGCSRRGRRFTRDATTPAPPAYIDRYSSPSREPAFLTVSSCGLPLGFLTLSPLSVKSGQPQHDPFSSCELLVSAGLARIYRTRTPLPDGRDSRAYLAHLAELEAQAKAAKRGAWR